MTPKPTDCGLAIIAARGNCRKCEAQGSDCSARTRGVYWHLRRMEHVSPVNRRPDQVAAMSVIPVTSVQYPESDGKPMGETDEHREEMIRLTLLLKRYFAGQNAYVSGNLLLFYEQGNPKKFVVPDVFVVKGIEAKQRRFYKLWVEHRTPDCDPRSYFAQDKEDRYHHETGSLPPIACWGSISSLTPHRTTSTHRCRGYRLVGEHYDVVTPDAQGMLVSKQLGLRLRPESGHLLLHRLDTGERLLTADEELLAQSQTLQATTPKLSMPRSPRDRQRSKRDRPPKPRWPGCAKSCAARRGNGQAASRPRN